jgi:hypothetical protein
LVVWRGRRQAFVGLRIGPVRPFHEALEDQRLKKRRPPRAWPVRDAAKSIPASVPLSLRVLTAARPERPHEALFRLFSIRPRLCEKKAVFHAQ